MWTSCMRSTNHWQSCIRVSNTPIDLDASHCDPHELLYRFPSSHHPKPSCSYHEVDQAGETTYCCDQIADYQDLPLCHSHFCVLGDGTAGVRWPNEIHPFSIKGMLCNDRMCLSSDGNDQPKNGIDKEINKHWIWHTWRLRWKYRARVRLYYST